MTDVRFKALLSKSEVLLIFKESAETATDKSALYEVLTACRLDVTELSELDVVELRAASAACKEVALELTIRRTELSKEAKEVSSDRARLVSPCMIELTAAIEVDNKLDDEPMLEERLVVTTWLNSEREASMAMARSRSTDSADWARDASPCTNTARLVWTTPARESSAETLEMADAKLAARAFSAVVARKTSRDSAVLARETSWAKLDAMTIVEAVARLVSAATLAARVVDVELSARPSACSAPMARERSDASDKLRLDWAESAALA